MGTIVDSLLLTLVEQLCHRLQRVAGVTNVWLAVQLTNLTVAGYFAWAAAYSARISMTGRIALALFCVALFYALTQTILKVPVETYENAVYQRVAKGLRNPRRVRDAPLRTAFLLLSVVLAYPIGLIFITLRVHIVILSYVLMLQTTAVLYLLACDPLPPCTGKVREWLRALAASRLPTTDAPFG
jgi:hypothetical protein